MGQSSNTLTTRKRRELAVDSQALQDELGHWLEASTRGTKLEKHYSQIRAVAAILQELSSAAVDRTTRPTVDLEDAARIETELLALHCLWDFFRSKLSVRCVPWLRPPLEAADELAWACYRPALEHLAPELGKEPPLVFPNAVASPFTIPRGSAFRLASPEHQGLDESQFAEALQALPIPVIGIPWLQGERLLGALVIGHEVGHDVEHALGLGPVIDTLIAARVPDDNRRQAWLQWRAEVFADIYGTLAGGPAFTATLIDFLAGERRKIEGRRLSGPVFGDYPTRPLRVRVSIATLQSLGFGDQADALWKIWSDTYPQHAMREYEPDVEVVVGCILEGPYAHLENAGLTTLLTFTSDMQRLAKESADELVYGGKPPSTDVRVLFAAARIAFESSADGYLGSGGTKQLVAKVRGLRGEGTRAASLLKSKASPATRDQLSAQRIQDVLNRAVLTAAAANRGD